MPSYAEAVRQARRKYLTAVLRRHGYNLSRAARSACVARSSFYQLLDRYDVARRP
jgi:DNA-binding NtrC family response regulator